MNGQSETMVTNKSKAKTVPPTDIGPRLVLVNKPLSEMNAAAYNPRIDLKPGDKEYDKLKASMDKFGYVEPIVWNKQTQNIVGGHQRFKVLIEQGATTAEVVVVDLDLKDEKALNIALNRIQGDWDYNKLKAVMKDLDNDMRIHTGFDADEVAMLVRDDPIQVPDLDGRVAQFEKPGEGDGPECNRSFVVYMTFKTREGADAWLASQGFDFSIKVNARTIVIQEGDIPRPPSTSS